MLAESLAAGPDAGNWFPAGGAARIGAARCDITPTVGIRARNWGAARSDVSTGVHRPITGTVMSIQSLDTAQPDQQTPSDEPVWERPSYLITLDLVNLRPDADTLVRQGVLEALDIGEDQLLLHSVHTHAGPTCALDESELPGGELVRPFLEQTVRHLVDACRRATAAATSCRLSWSYGHCALAVVRDLPCENRDAVGFNPELAADDTVTVGRVTGPGGDPVAVVLNYACHPTTLAWENSLLSPDYVGAARQVVEDAVGAPCLFLQGASGDLSPREQYVGDPAVADRNGRTLGYAALSVLEAMPPPGTAMHFDGVVESGAPLGIWTYQHDGRSSGLARRRVDVPVRLKPERTAQDVARLWPHIDPVAAQERVRRAQRLRAEYSGRTDVHHPVWIWMVGDAVLVAHPGEAYSALQVELRRRHPDRVIVVMNLTNAPGAFYLPTADAYARDRYQCWQTQYQAGTLEAVVDAADTVIRGLPVARGTESTA